MDQIERSEDLSSSSFINPSRNLMPTPEIKTSQSLGGKKRRIKLTIPLGIKGYEDEVNEQDQSYQKLQQSPQKQQSYQEDLTDQSKSVNVSYIYPDKTFSHSIKIRNHSVRMSAKSRALFSPISSSKPLQNDKSLTPVLISQTQYPSLKNKINNSFHIKYQEEQEEEEPYQNSTNLSYSFKNSMNSFLQRSANKEEIIKKKIVGPRKIISELLLEEEITSHSNNPSRKSETPRLKAAGGYNQARFTQRVPRPIDLDYQGDVVHVFGDLTASSTNSKIRENIDIENSNQTKRAMLVIIKDASRFLSALKIHKYFYEPLELISEGRRKRGQSPLALVKRLDSNVINKIVSNSDPAEQSQLNNWIKTKLIHIHIGNAQRRNSKKKILDNVFQNIDELKGYVEQLLKQPENGQSQQSSLIQTLQFPQFSPKSKSGFIESYLENYSTPKSGTKSAISLQEWHFYNASLQHINHFYELNIENEGALSVIIACPYLLQEINISDTFGEKDEDEKQDHHSRMSKNISDDSNLTKFQQPGSCAAIMSSNKKQKERVSSKNRTFSQNVIFESNQKANESTFHKEEVNQSKDNEDKYQHSPRSVMLLSQITSRSPQSMQLYRSKETTLFEFSLNPAVNNSDQIDFSSPIRSNSKNLSSSRQSSSPKKNQTYLFTHLSQRANRLRDLKINEIKEVTNQANTMNSTKNQQLINEEIIQQNKEKVLYQFRPKWVKVRRGMSNLRGSILDGQSQSIDNEHSQIHKIQQQGCGNIISQANELETMKKEKPTQRDSVISKNRMNNSRTSKKVYDSRRVDTTLQRFLEWLGISSFRQISEIVFKESFFDLSLSELEGIFSEFVCLSEECTQFMQSAAPLAASSSVTFSQNIQHLFQYFIHIDLHLLKRSFKVFSRFKELNILRSVIKFLIPQQSHLIDLAFNQRQLIDIPFFWQDFLKFKVTFILQKWSKNQKLEFIILAINPDHLDFIPLKNVFDLFPEGLRFPDPRQIKSFKDYLLNPLFLREGCVPFPRIADCLQKEICFPLSDIIKYFTSQSLP